MATPLVVLRMVGVDAARRPHGRVGGVQKAGMQTHRTMSAAILIDPSPGR
jgi:hypothetical protein